MSKKKTYKKISTSLIPIDWQWLGNILEAIRCGIIDVEEECVKTNVRLDNIEKLFKS